MNYFELFELPVSFHIDNGVLEKKYFELTLKYPPGLSAGNNMEALSGIAEKASWVEKGYQLFQDPDKTIEYVLQLKGMLPDDETYEMPPQFMMEVMDINQEIAELEMDEKQEQLMNVEQKAHTLLQNIYEDVTNVITAAKEDPVTEEALLQVKEYYHQQKYLERILERIHGIRNIASPL